MKLYTAIEEKKGRGKRKIKVLYIVMVCQSDSSLY